MISPVPSFRVAPLAWLDETFKAGAGAAWIDADRLCVADAAEARKILRNTGGCYAESSDFFDTRAGTLPRAAQIEIGYGGRALLQSRSTPDVVAALLAGMAPRSQWPDAGNALLMNLVAPVLARASRPPAFHRLVRSIVHRRVMASERGRARPLTRMGLRFRTFMALTRERQPRERRRDEPADVLDVILAHAGPAAPTEQVMEVYLSFLFAMTGSVAFALAWTLFLALSTGRRENDPSHLVTEALRLYPVAWLLDRRAAAAHEVLGETVKPPARVVVCPYAIQRSPRYWDDPQSFRPERWIGRADRAAWLPFGAGPHVCVAAAGTVDLVSMIVGQMFATYDADIEKLGEAPSIAAALAPPPFVLNLRRRG